MKQVININFQGRIVPIEVTAYDLLKQYIDSLQKHFANEDGKEEIVNDIESRIGELFQERLKKSTCIIDDDVNAVIKSIGRPQDFDDATETTEASSTNTKQEENTNTAQAAAPGARKRLYRDENNKFLGGVCSGIANYFDIDIAIVRILFVIAILSFGIGIIPYIVLWIAVPSSATTTIGSRRKKLYRDKEDAYIGGVASGIAQYFGIENWIPRLIFLLPVLTSVFSRNNNWFNNNPFRVDFNDILPSFTLIYVILWIILPEATTTSEKLEMKGEKVDLNSISSSVKEEMQSVGQKMQKFGSSAAAVAAEKANNIASDTTRFVKSGGSSGLASVIRTLVKAFVFFILGTIGVGLLIGLFVAAVGSFKLLPAKDFLLNAGWQNALGWGTLLFFILTPIVAAITFIIRRITKSRAGSKGLTIGFIALWILGWVCVSFLGASLDKDFAEKSNLPEENVYMANPNTKALDVVTNNPAYRIRRNRWNDNDFFLFNARAENAEIKNVKVNILKATGDSFKISIIKMADGSTEAVANNTANLINYDMLQKDSSLVIPSGFNITKQTKFRNQRILIQVYVPVGKRIRVQSGIDILQQLQIRTLGFSLEHDDEVELENAEQDWSSDTWYTMTDKGLYTLQGVPASEYKYNRNNNRRGTRRIELNDNGVVVEENFDNTDNSGDYRYNKKVEQSMDSAFNQLQNEKQRYQDSLQKEKKKIDEMLQKATAKTTTVNAVMPLQLLLPNFWN
jgi:phage shock protein PspC (stress-responsive transcriptional regulator)